METSCSTSNLFISFFWNPSYLGLFLSICKFLIKVIALKKNSFAPLIDLFGTGRWWIFDRVLFFLFFFVFFYFETCSSVPLWIFHIFQRLFGVFFSQIKFFFLNRRLQAEIATLTGHYKEEILKGRRLSMEKEELQWKLSLHNEPSLNGTWHSKIYF